MKTLVLFATTTLLAAVVIMPVSAEPCAVKTQSAVVQTESAKPQSLHLFHAKKIAVKSSDGSQATETVKPGKVNLDYGTDNFIIN
jgi:hypothetical protein